MIIQLKLLKRGLIDDGKVVKYLLYAIGEICLVVIGILIALQFNNMNLTKQYRKTELQYYETMKSQLVEDRGLIENELHGLAERKHVYSIGSRIIENNDRNRMDELAKISLRLLEYGDFRRRSNVFQTLVYSGEIKHIKNKNIIGILQELERIYKITERLEGTQASMVMNHSAPAVLEIINVTTAEIVSADLEFSPLFTNLFPVTSNIVFEKITLFGEAIGQIDMALAEIDAELETAN